MLPTLTVAVGAHTDRTRAPVAGIGLVDVLVSLAILGILASVGLPGYSAYVAQSRSLHVEQDIIAIETAIAEFNAVTHGLPASLADIRMDDRRDPWGNSYQYMSFEGGRGTPRTGRNHKPVSTDYDLYSVGPDGRSVSRLTDKVSRDDIIRADDGGFIGRVADYRGARGTD